MCPPRITPPDPWLGAALGQLLREIGAPGLVSRERKKADFQSAATRTGFVTNCRALLSFHQVKGPVVVAGEEVRNRNSRKFLKMKKMGS